MNRLVIFKGVFGRVKYPRYFLCRMLVLRWFDLQIRPKYFIGFSSVLSSYSTQYLVIVENILKTLPKFWVVRVPFLKISECRECPTQSTPFDGFDAVAKPYGDNEADRESEMSQQKFHTLDWIMTVG